MDNGSLKEILNGLTGQLVTVVNRNSYIPTITGFRIDSQTYKAKIVSAENGTLRILIEYMTDPHKKTMTKAFQFIPIDQIKQLTLSNSERLLMI